MAHLGQRESTMQEWSARDGKRLTFCQWPADAGAARQFPAVVIAIHGLSGATSNFDPLGEYLSSRGYAVYSFNLRSQGGDPDPQSQGNLTSEHILIDDVLDFTALIRERHPEAPLFYYGESMGAILALHAAARDGDAAAGLIMASPVTEISAHLKPWHRALFHVAHFIWPTFRFHLDSVIPKNAPTRLTRDSECQNAIMERRATLFRFTLRFFLHVGRMIERASAAAAQVRCPVLVVHGGSDVFIPAERVEAFFELIGSARKERRYFPEACHLLLFDDDSREVLAAVGRWLESCIPAAEAAARLDSTARPLNEMSMPASATRCQETE